VTPEYGFGRLSGAGLVPEFFAFAESRCFIHSCCELPVAGWLIILLLHPLRVITLQSARAGWANKLMETMMAESTKCEDAPTCLGICSDHTLLSANSEPMAQAISLD